MKSTPGAGEPKNTDMTIVTEKRQLTNESKPVSNDYSIVMLSRCLTDKCSKCSGTYVSTALSKRFKCNCRCHGAVQTA